jgi:hypothetical protein
MTWTVLSWVFLQTYENRTEKNGFGWRNSG